MLTVVTALGLLSGFAASGAARPAWHAVAFVNDWRSHGVVGDGFLSLNEAILLHNGTLAFAQLSAAEQQQLSLIPGTGATTDVTWIDIDGTNTPVITIEQDLAPVLDTTFGLLIKGFGDRPMLDFSGPGITHGLRAPANSLVLQDLVLSGGPYGVDVTQTDVSGQAGAVLTNVRIEGQATFGLRVTAPQQNGVGRVILERCEFANVPTAITLDESGAGRTSIFEAHELTITGAVVGCDAVLGPGGSTRYTFDRVTIAAGQRGIRLQRPAGANRQAYLEGSFVRVRAADCVSFACHPSALTWALLHLWDLRSTGNGLALQLGSAGDALFGEVTECTLEGATTIGAGSAPFPLALANLRCKNGAVVLATSAGQALTITATRFDNCAVTTAGSGPIVATTCCALASTLTGTAAAPLVCSDSFVPNGAFVQSSQPAAAPQLGSMAIVPEDVVMGATVQFTADLPPGLLGLFALGFTDPTPSLLGAPFQVYFDLASYVIVPGAYALQQSFAWNVPANSAFIGFDLFAHLLVLPAAGMQAPWLQLPPGRRFVLQ